MTNACHKKCVPPKYHENDLTKGESICIDRCVAKYFEIHDRVGKKLTALSTQQAQAQIASNAGAEAPK
jgi:import inner membrane translocase subunit TIM10